MSAPEKPIEQLLDETEQRLRLLECNLPARVDGWALSQISKLPFKSLSFRESLIYRMVELGRSAFEDFANNKLVSAILLTRGAVETSAALWYLCAKVEAAVQTGAVGDIDEYLMRLSVGSRTDPDMRRAIKVSAFLKCVDKDIEGFSHGYGQLCEFAHPNWAGTTLLYSKPDATTPGAYEFGSNIRGGDGAYAVGVVNLSVALLIFERSYSRLGDLMPGFVTVCENHLQPSA
jgi:hypothetical protein